MRRTFRIAMGLAICLAATAFVLRPQETDDPLDSLKVCAATQKLIFENQFVRVIDDQIPPGVTEPMHRHRHGVSVYLSNYINENVTQDGRKSKQERKAGTAQWNEPTVHTVTNTDSVSSHSIRIELKY